MLVTEMAAYYRSKGMTLKDAMDSLYARYGSFGESVMSIAMPGADGKEKMSALMSSLRERTPSSIAGENVIGVRDYLVGTITDTVSGKSEDTGLPRSNVLYYSTENCVLVIRPSGTEPKVKTYFMARGKNNGEVQDRINALKKSAEELLK